MAVRPATTKIETLMIPAFWTEFHIKKQPRTARYSDLSPPATLRIVSTPRLTECTYRPDGVDPNPLFKKPGSDGKTQYVVYRVLLRATTCCG